MKKILTSRSLPLLAAALLVLGFFAWSVGTGRNAAGDRIAAADQNYNRLARSLGERRLDLDVPVPDGLKKLADPYDPVSNGRFRSSPFWLHDLSYYRGKVYMYFGITPALLVFGPWTILTEEPLRDAWGVAILCAVGFLAGAALVLAAWRRYFPSANSVFVGLVVLALGFASGAPMLLQRADFWEAAVAGGQAMVLVALVCVWRALHEPGRLRWLAWGSLAYGLAIGSRPPLLCGAAILLIPVAWQWRGEGARGGRLASLLLAALGPVAACGAALLVYNQLRFGHPLEFGQTYQLAGEREAAVSHFGFRYLWTNLRIYFWQPARWAGSFPFVRTSVVPALPSGHGRVEDCFGAALNLPFVWLAVAAVGALAPGRLRAGDGSERLGYFTAAIAWCCLSSALILGLFFGCTLRYEFELLTPLCLLAAIGALRLDASCRPWRFWRPAAGAVTGALAVFSVAFALLAGFHLHAQQLDQLAQLRFAQRNYEAAAATFESVLAFEPGEPDASMQLSLKAFAEERPTDGVRLLERSSFLNPGNAALENALGIALGQAGRPAEAASHFRRTLELQPGFPAAEQNLVTALEASGHRQEAIAELDRAISRHLADDSLLALMRKRLLAAKDAPRPETKAAAAAK